MGRIFEPNTVSCYVVLKERVGHHHASIVYSGLHGFLEVCRSCISAADFGCLCLVVRVRLP